MGAVNLLRHFFSIVSQSEFGEVNLLLSAIGDPPYDYIFVDNMFVNVKMIASRIKATLMQPWMNSQQYQSYDPVQAMQDKELLIAIYPSVSNQEKNLLARLVGALSVLEKDKDYYNSCDDRPAPEGEAKKPKQTSKRARK